VNFNDLPPDMGKHLAAAGGSATAMAFFKGESWKSYAAAFVAGYLMSLHLAPLVASTFPRLADTASYLVGLFGFIVVKKLFDTWVQFDAGTLLKQWVSRKLGLDKP